LWLKPASLMRRFPNNGANELHRHSTDAVVQSFFASLKSWCRRRQADPNAKPPRRRRRYFKVIWKSSALKVQDGKLYLSNGKGNLPVVISWAWGTPVQVEIGWDGKQYERRACYDLSQTAEDEPNEEAITPQTGEVAGVDSGEVHKAVAHDGVGTLIANGRLLRAKRRYQNKLKGKLSRLMARKKKGSRRRKRLISSRQKPLAKLRKQIRDILHKQTTRLVSTLHAGGVQTVVMGDIRDRRRSARYNQVANQKIHQMSSGQLRQMLTFKGGCKWFCKRSATRRRSACVATDSTSPVAGSIIAEPVVFGSIATASDRPICAESIWDSLMSRQLGSWHPPSGCGTDRISDAAQEVGAILQPEKESFAFR